MDEKVGLQLSGLQTHIKTSSLWWNIVEEAAFAASEPGQAEAQISWEKK